MRDCVDCYLENRSFTPASHKDGDDEVCYAHKVKRCDEEPPPNPPSNADRRRILTARSAQDSPSAGSGKPSQPSTPDEDADPGTAGGLEPAADPGKQAEGKGRRRTVQAQAPENRPMCRHGCGRPRHRGRCAGDGRPGKGGCHGKHGTGGGRPRQGGEPKGIREISADEFGQMFGNRVGRDAWVDKTIQAIEKIPLSKFYLLEIPEPRSSSGVRRMLEAHFKGRTFRIRLFGGRGRNQRRLGIYKQACAKPATER